MKANIICPFQGKEIDDVPLEVLMQWVADTKAKFEKFPPREHRLAVLNAVKARIEAEACSRSGPKPQISKEN